MMNEKPFVDKINEIENRMDYVIDNWQSDREVLSQEIRFAFAAYLYELYKNQKVKDSAKTYIQKLGEKKRLDSEMLLTAITSLLVINRGFTEYWDKLKNLIDRSHGTERHNLIMQFLIILTPKAFKKLKKDDKNYIENLIEELEQQDEIGKKLFSYWTEKRLFSNAKEMRISPEQIQHLKEYVLWELINSEEYEQKEDLRNKFLPEVFDFKVERIEWIVFLIYQFLKKNRMHFITEDELNRKISHKVKSSISKKVWFPVIASMIFLLIKLSLANVITKETVGQILLLIIGALLLFFEEKLPSFEVPVKRYKITSGQIGEFLIIFSILWALKLVSLIKEVFP